MDRNQLINDTETVIRYALDGKQATIWTAMPAIVQSVDFSRMTCVVQPAIQGAITGPDGKTVTYVNLPLLADVPICFPSAGGFTLTLPLKSGDEVLVIIASRCIDAWWQNGGIGIPIESRMHDLSDGFAIPGPKSLPNAISAISSTNAQLRTDSGAVFLEITSSGVNITGNLKVTGTIEATSTVTGSDVIAGTHALKSHNHTVPIVGPAGTTPTTGPLP
jgi:hypothetical protein